MCRGEGCELKNTCLRFMATPNEYRQSYFLNIPIDSGECKFYINEKQKK